MQTAREMALGEARRAGVPEDMFMRLIKQESGWNPKATSPVGAYGLTQAMPASWAQPGFGVQAGGDRNNPKEQLRFGADYLSAMLKRYDGDQRKASGAYNWGAGNIDKWNGDPASLPEETRNYMNIVAGQGSPDGGDTIMQGSGGRPSMMGGPAQDSMMGNSPVTEEPDNRSIMDKIKDSAKSAEFNPGVALQSLGAAISAGSQGQSAAPQFADIRAQYQKQQNYQAEKAQEMQENASMMKLFKNDPEMLQAIEAGLPIGEAMKIRQQQQQFDQDQSMQRERFGQQEKMQGIVASSRASENAMDRASRLELTQGGWLRDDAQLAERVRMNNEAIDQWGQEFGRDTEQLKADNAKWTDEFALKEGQYLKDRQNEGVAGAAGQEFVAAQYERMGQAADAKRVREMDAAAFQDPAMMARFTDLMTVPATKDSRTAKAKDWELYQTIAKTDPEAAEAFLKSSNSGSTFNLGNKADVEWVKADAATMKTERETISDSQGSLDALGQMSVILADNPDVSTGRLSALIQAPLEILAQAGLLPEGLQKDTLTRAELGQLGTYLATTIKTPGSVSDYEQKAFKAAMPGPETPDEQIKYVLDYHTKRLERAKARAVFMENNMRSGEGMGYGAAQQMWDKAIEVGDPSTKPLVANFDTFSMENLQEFEFTNSRAIYQGGQLVSIVSPDHLNALFEKTRREREKN